MRNNRATKSRRGNCWKNPKFLYYLAMCNNYRHNDLDNYAIVRKLVEFDDRIEKLERLFDEIEKR